MDTQISNEDYQKMMNNLLEEKLKKSKATKVLIDYLISESQFKHTEFRLVVQDGGEDCYIHVMNRDSETLDFSLKSALKLD